MILINAASPDRMGMISHYSSVTPPINIGTLAGYIMSKGGRVRIIDELVNPIDKDLTNIKEGLKGLSKPYIFGISCLTINIARGLEIAGLIKAAYPDSKIIFGGIHPTILPDESLNSKAVDIVVRGEGEETLFALYDCIKNNKKFSDVKGISFIKDSTHIHNPDRPLIDNLDVIPQFPYELFNNAGYNLGFMMTSRGCPYNCIFCSQRHISGGRYRCRSNEAVVEEIDLLANKYKQKFISFLDDEFLVNKERVRTLCDLIIRYKLNKKVNLACQARANNINKEILGHLKEAGFSHIGLGIETGSDRLMRVIDKGVTVRDNINAVKLIQDAGFVASAFFMFGIPSETSKERFQTYMLAKGLKLRYAKFNNMVPYPGTRLFAIAKEEGSLTIEENWRNFNSVGSIVEGVFSKFKLPYVPKGTTQRQLKKDLVWANFYFYLSSPSTLLSLLGGKNLDWFSISEKWYLSLKEYYYLVKLSLRILINVIAVFHIRWIIDEILWWIGARKFKTK